MKIEHIAMYVNDLEGTRAFFVKYLGGVSNGISPLWKIQQRESIVQGIFI